jgi:ribonuclease Z
MKRQKYPLYWKSEDYSIKVFCSIPNLATGILLSAGKSLFVIDPGDGILRDLNKDLGTLRILDISDVFISHGHHDHVGGLWSFLTYLRVMNKKTPLSIFYPKGCIEIESIYNAFNKVYSKSLTYPLNLVKISGGDTLRRKKVTINPFEVIHKEYIAKSGATRPVPALGFRFSYNRKKICYGGDTAWCENLVKMCKNSDLAIIEAGHDDSTEDDLHLSFSEAEQLGKSAKDYFLVHVPE